MNTYKIKTEALKTYHRTRLFKTVNGYDFVFYPDKKYDSDPRDIIILRSETSKIWTPKTRSTYEEHCMWSISLDDTNYDFRYLNQFSFDCRIGIFSDESESTLLIYPDKPWFEKIAEGEKHISKLEVLQSWSNLKE